VTLRFVLAAVFVLVGGACSHVPEQASDFRPVATLINDTIRANHYRPTELDTARYRQIENDVIALSATAESGEAFRTGFNGIWKNGPFSHVTLLRAEETAAERYARMDTMLAGTDAVTLTWQGQAAILTVNTMSGADTIERIEASYDEIAARGAERLIIDLRRNTGGAFAVVPLVGHLIEAPVDAGVFVSGAWYKDHDRPPGPADFPSATPWRGYSVRAFQADMLSRPLTSYRIDPMQPRYQGRVYVLTSDRSISAAEIAADVLKATGRAKVIGERTPGVVLSSKRFDVPGGFHLMVPVADYFSVKHGRIEGVGVTPDMPVDADTALNAALGL
jgi:carboxyl-terminal processing protease